jgi:hypothetical protein
MSAQDPQVVGEEAFEDDELDYEVEEEYSGDEELIDDDAAVLGQQEGLVDEEYDSEEGEEIDEDGTHAGQQRGAAMRHPPGRGPACSRFVSGPSRPASGGLAAHPCAVS